MPVDQEMEDKSDDNQATLSMDNNLDFDSSSSEKAEEAEEMEDKSDDNQTTLSMDNNSDFGSSSSEEAEEVKEMKVDNFDQENIKKTHVSL
jgi:hypothetical protein